MYAQSVLIADASPAVWQELPRTLGSWLPHKRFDLCLSPDEALDRVVDPAYEVVISSAGFAESENFFLLKGLKCLSVPLVITTVGSTLASSRRALEEGAFGLICLPIDAKLAAQTVLLATWVSDILRRITAYRDSLKYYRAHLCPPDAELEELLERWDVVLETTPDSSMKTIMNIEKSVQHLARTVVALETEARLHAHAQLRGLEIEKASSSLL